MPDQARGTHQQRGMHRHNVVARGVGPVVRRTSAGGIGITGVPSTRHDLTAFFQPCYFDQPCIAGSSVQEVAVTALRWWIK